MLHGRYRALDKQLLRVTDWDALITARCIGSFDTRLILLNALFEGAEKMEFGK